jgi:hypothetical protein
MSTLKLSNYHFEIYYCINLKMYDFSVLDKNKNVIYHYHFSNLNDINKLIHKYKNK